MAPRITWLLASLVAIGCSNESTVWPYADSAGEGGGTWLATGFAATSGIVVTDNDVFVVSGSAIVHTSAHSPPEGQMNGYDVVNQTGEVALIVGDADNLYVAALETPNGEPEGQSGFIYRRSIASGSMVTLASAGDPIALAIDASNVYWIEAPDGATKDSTNSLIEVPKSGGATTTVATNLPIVVVSIAVGDSNIYVATGDSILAIAKVGSSPPVTIASSQNTPMAIAASGSTVYWTTQGKTLSGPGALYSATSGGSIQTLATDLYGPLGLAVDATRVYFSSYRVQGQPDGTTVMSMPRDGGAPKILGRGQGAPMYLAATSSALYWTDTEGDSLTSGSIKVAESK